MSARALALAVLTGLVAAPPAHALLETGGDRTPTWTSFRVHERGTQEKAAFFGLGAFCQFPEQFAPKRPNPRWESERPFRQHFVEHLNPAFSGCLLRPFVAMPQFHDFKIPAQMVFEFEKSLPPGFQPHASGSRTATFTSNFAVAGGRVFRLPELQGAQDQAVTVRFSVFGKPLSEIGFRIDSGYTLDFQQYDRASDDEAPAWRRQWVPR